MLKLVAGLGVGMVMRVVGTVRTGYKCVSPCSSLLQMPIPAKNDMDVLLINFTHTRLRNKYA